MTATTHKNRRSSAVWALVLTWLTTILLVVVTCLLTLMTTVAHPGYMKSQIRRSGYADLVYEYLYEDFCSYGASTGFDSDVICSVLSADQINADMEKTVDKLYAGNTQMSARNDFQSQVNQVLLANLAQRGVDVTEDIQNAVSIVADACRLDYADYVSIPLAGQLSAVISKINKLLIPSIAVSSIFCAVSLILMLRLAGKPRLGVRCLTYAFTSAALLCLLGSTSVYPMLGLDRIPLRPESLRLLILNYIRGIFTQLSIFAAILALVAGLLLALQCIGSKPKKAA